jgi:GDSL-like lipase/acylhydrolase family protein
MAKLTIPEVQRKIADPTTPPEELGRYFLADEGESGPFDPALRYNPETVELPASEEMRARGDVLLAGANGWARLRRRWAFESRLAAGYEGPVIVSEGDSWFQYPLRLEDVIDHLMNDYAILSLDAAGDTLQNMFDEGEYLGAIQETKASVFLFSGGGNDVLGGGNLSAHLRDFDPSLSPADHILPSYRDVLDHAIALYDRIFRAAEDAPGDVLTLCHGYDRPVPNGGRWLGRPMRQRGMPDGDFHKAVTAAMVERFNARLKKLADTFPRVEYVDLRGVVGDDPARWDDELHPTSAAYADVAARFRAVINRKAAPRSLAESRRRGESRGPARPCAGRSMRAARRPTAPPPPVPWPSVPRRRGRGRRGGGKASRCTSASTPSTPATTAPTARSSRAKRTPRTWRAWRAPRASPNWRS